MLYSREDSFSGGIAVLTGYSRFTGEDYLLDISRDAVNWTMSYHGNAAGSVIGDERLAGLGPNRGYDFQITSEL